MSVVLYHPTTAPFVQQAARALYDADLLDRYYTAVIDDPRSTWQRAACAAARLLGRDLRRQLRRRAVTEVPLDRVTSFPFRELVRLTVSALDRGGRLTDSVWEWAEPGFDRRVSRQLHDGLRGVYGFEFSSLATFTAARARGLRTIYDLPAPEPEFVQRILAREFERFPELSTPYRAHTRTREPRRTARRRAEWSAADLVIVASDFTRQSYASAGLDVSKTRVVPYGAPPAGDRDTTLPAGGRSGPVTFLWAGTFSIRKGAHHLLEAWKQARLGEHARLKVFGAIGLPDRLIRPLPAGVELGGSIPRDELMREYHNADALVFPTLCDGFGMVVTEAWSRGLPVITTRRAGAADLLRPGENGVLVDAADPTQLAQTLTWAVEHRAELNAMREGALDTAARWQWSDYRRALVAAIRPTLSS